MAERQLPPGARRLERQVGAKERRKIRSRGERRRTAWFGLGMFGLVGWSVAVPTLLGIALGVWIDYAFPSRVSWTLTLMFLGLVLGCFNAWRWIEKEGRDG